MIIALVMYWIVCGFATFMLPTKHQLYGFSVIAEFGLCLAIGGFIVPARAVAKLIQ